MNSYTLIPTNFVYVGPHSFAVLGSKFSVTFFMLDVDSKNMFAEMYAKVMNFAYA